MTQNTSSTYTPNFIEFVKSYISDSKYFPLSIKFK